jgi:hypothetical protein
MTNYAVMADNRLITATGERILNEHLHIGFWNLERLFDLASKQGVKQLWVARDSSFWGNVQLATGEAWPQFWETGRWTTGSKTQNGITGWVEAVRDSKVQINFCGLREDRWAFDSQAEPETLFEAIEIFRKHTGLLPTFPQEIGRLMFERTNSFELQDLAKDHFKTPEIFWKPFLENTAAALRYIRPISAAEKKRKFVHSFDKRRAYLDAMNAAYFGIGAYEIIEDLDFAALPKTAVGFCEVEPFKLELPEFPEFAKWIRKILTGERFTMAYLRLLAELGAEIRIKRGYVWREPRRIFEAWSKPITAGYAQTLGATDPAEQMAHQAFKHLYTRFYGWLRSSNHATGWGAKYYRPDWFNEITALAGANLLRNVFKAYKASGLLPVEIDTDQITYFSDKEAPAEFADTRFLHPNVFAYKGTFPAKEIRKLLRKDPADYRAGSFAAAIRELRGEQNV